MSRARPIIEVKALPTGPTGEPGHWYYGPDYMVRVSSDAVRRLLRGFSPPRMGYESDLCRPHGLSGPRLTVQNISGDYFLASCTDDVSAWSELFGVRVINHGGKS